MYPSALVAMYATILRSPRLADVNRPDPPVSRKLDPLPFLTKFHRLPISRGGTLHRPTRSQATSQNVNGQPRAFQIMPHRLSNGNPTVVALMVSSLTFR